MIQNKKNNITSEHINLESALCYLSHYTQYLQPNKNTLIITLPPYTNNIDLEKKEYVTTNVFFLKNKIIFYAKPLFLKNSLNDLLYTKPIEFKNCILAVDVKHNYRLYNETPQYIKSILLSAIKAELEKR